MNRAFLTLYGFIVLAVVGVGWGLDKLWQYYSPEVGVSHSQSDLIAAIESNLLNANSFEDKKQIIVSLQARLSSQMELIEIEDFASSAMLEQLKSGEPLIVHSAEGEQLLYKLISNRQGLDSAVLLMRSVVEKERGSIFYYALLVLFYCSIAIAVFIWVWPLSRDLRKLESQTRSVGKDNLPLEVEINPRSTVYELSVAFKKMIVRIRELIASHKEMTYAVSHELRTPLARMKFALEMAADSNDIEKIKKQLLGVREDVTDMDHLVAELLSYAGYEQDEIQLNLEAGHLKYFIPHLIERIQQNDKTKNVEFEFNNLIENREVECEWHLMERAVLNLIQNAQRFAKRKVLITAKLHEGNVCIVVEDDGEGVPAEDRSRIFQSFVRLSNHANAQVRGFGLGLAIVKRIIGWHRGEVLVESSELGGACFILCWPDSRVSE